MLTKASLVSQASRVSGITTITRFLQTEIASLEIWKKYRKILLVSNNKILLEFKNAYSETLICRIDI